MKNSLRFSLAILLTLSFQVSFGQTSLFGTWTASCPIEKTNPISFAFCDLCPMITDKNSLGQIGTFELTVNKDNLKLSIDGKITTTEYSWDELIQTIEFRYKETNYRFNLLMGVPGNLHILKAEGGQIIVLIKKPESKPAK